ncbi:MAG: hypothetical protein PVH29_12940 [Candidatus Zixiibacteriota bacterium]|jgi:hypothetical protein
MDRGRILLYAGLAALAAAVFAFAAYLRQALAVSAGFDAAVVVAAGSLLGFAFGAAYVAILGSRAGKNPAGSLAFNSILFGATALIVGIGLGRISLDVAGSSSGWAWLMLLVYLAFGALPGRFAGVAFGVAFRLQAGEPNRVYALLLGGAGAGVLLAAAAFALSGHAAALALIVVLAAAAAGMFYFETSKAKLAAPAVLALVAIILPFAAPSLFVLAPTPGAFLGASGNEVTRVAWSASSRAELSAPGPGEKDAAALAAAGGDVVPVLPEHQWLTVNGRAASPALGGDAAGEFLKNYAPAFACRLKMPEAALVVGGGGFDAATMAALCAGRVDLVVDGAVREVLMGSGYADEMFDPARVNIHAGDGRSFLRGRSDMYDLIFLSPAEVPVPGEAAPSLAPDYGLTVSAFREYYRHLKPDGVIAVVARSGETPGPAHKLAATLYRALRDEGELQPANDIVIFERGGLVVIFAEPGGFDALEVEGLAGIAGEDFEPRYLPGHKPSGDAAESYATLLTVDAPAGDYGKYEYDVRPATDNRPFPVSPAEGTGLSLSAGNVGRPFGVSVLVLTVVFGAALLLVTVFFFRKQKVTTGGKGAFALYFLVVGMAFAALATSFLSKVSFYLGGGSWSGPTAFAILAVVAAAGSMLSGKIARRRRWLPFVMVAAATLLYLFAFDALFAATAGWAWLVRFYVAVVLVALVGFFLGALAPVGLAAAAGRGPAMLPWLLSAYILAYVFGDVGSQLLAAAAGFRVTVGVAFVLLIAGWVVFTRASRSHLPPVAEEADSP